MGEDSTHEENINSSPLLERSEIYPLPFWGEGKGVGTRKRRLELDEEILKNAENFEKEEQKLKRGFGQYCVIVKSQGQSSEDNFLLGDLS